MKTSFPDILLAPVNPMRRAERSNYDTYDINAPLFGPLA